MCRLFKTAFTGFTLFLTAFSTASAQSDSVCEGVNLLEQVRREDPQAYQQIIDAAHAVPNAVGKFWKAEKPGIAPSYLFGTFHDTETHRYVDQAVWDALKAADGAWFELSEAEKQRVRKAVEADPLGMLFDLNAPPLSSRLSPEDVESLKAALADRGLSLEAVEQRRAWWLFSVLGLPACQLQALQAGAKTLDDRLAEFSIAEGVPNHGLETFDEAFAAIESMDLEATTQIISEFGFSASIEEDLRTTWIDFYRQGETQLVVTYGKWVSLSRGSEHTEEVNKAFLDQILVGRNRAWMDDLTAALEAGNAFVAVGALHLPGEEGLVELLRRDGWTLTRLDG